MNVLIFRTVVVNITTREGGREGRDGFNANSCKYVNFSLSHFLSLSVWVYRCFGAQVSWDKSLCIGSTYDITDETITHHVVDRPSLDKQHINRSDTHRAACRSATQHGPLRRQFAYVYMHRHLCIRHRATTAPRESDISRKCRSPDHTPRPPFRLLM